MSEAVTPFTPIKIGKILFKNRFIRSPVCESLADSQGVAKPALLQTIVDLAKGGVGMVIPGFVYVDPRGESAPTQTGLFDEKTASVWEKPIEAVHAAGSRLIFQIAHGGNDSVVDQPIGCSDPPPGFHPRSRGMTLAEVEETIEKFVASAVLASKVGADGVQLHGAHGYLLSQFLSPFTNKRADRYGGSVENRVRLVQEIASEIRKVVPSDFLVGIKMNGNDYRPGGVTPDLASRYVSETNLDFYEISCGIWDWSATIRSFPSPTLFRGLSPKVVAEIREGLASMQGIPYKPGYTFEAAKLIKEQNPGKIIASVGGWRRLDDIRKALLPGGVDMVSMARPLIRQPNLVALFESGAWEEAECKSCGGCLLRPRDHGAYCMRP